MDIASGYDRTIINLLVALKQISKSAKTLAHVALTTQMTTIYTAPAGKTAIVPVGGLRAVNYSSNGSSFTLWKNGVADSDKFVPLAQLPKNAIYVDESTFVISGGESIYASATHDGRISVFLGGWEI